MTEPKPADRPATIAHEDGVVIQDGPDSIALTMTPDAAAETGRRLVDAAREATPPAADDGGRA